MPRPAPVRRAPCPGRIARLAAAVAALAWSAGCTDFPTPAELTKPTVLAVIADPPRVAAGQSAALSTVVVDGGGVLAGLPTRYDLIETYAGVPPMGALVDAGGAIEYRAPDPVPELPEGAVPLDSVRVEVDTAVGTLTAIKVMGVVDLPGANPVIDRLSVGAGDGLVGPLTVPRSTEIAVEVSSDPPATDQARYAWYSSAGTIERYQSNPTELVTPDQPTSGWLFVVVRDGTGGVAWQGVEIHVE